MKSFYEMSQLINENEGLPSAEQQYQIILNQLKQQAEEYGKYQIILPASWVSGKDLMSSDEHPFPIEDIWDSWGLLKDAEVKGEMKDLNIARHNDKIMITFMTTNPEDYDKDDSQDGFSSDRDYNNYRFGGRRW